MKKLFSLLYFFIFSIQVISQISPGEFPKIGYTDMYWLKLKPMYGNGSSIDYTDSLWFYPQLAELGLTHVVTYGASTVSYNPSYNTDVNVIDINFMRGTDSYYYRPFKYSLGAGNHLDHFGYEVGGGFCANLMNESEHFGFGNSDRTSYWIWQYNGDCIGNTNHTDNLVTQPYPRVHFAQVGIDEPGILLKAKPYYLHLPYDVKWGHRAYYKLKIYARIDGAAGSTNVARVRIWEEVPALDSPIQSNHTEIFGYQEPAEPEALTDYTYYITADDFDGNNYTELISPSTFRKTRGIESGSPSELYITIEWLDTRNLYIDNISIYNKEYEDLFITNSATAKTNIKNDLNSVFGTISSSLFSHLYNDEPLPIFYRAIGEVSNLSEEKLGSGKIVNGATNALTNDLAMFANSQRRLPYVLYDYYPITENTSTSSTGTNNIQNAYDNLIYTNCGTIQGADRYRGLKVGIEMAQNFTPNDIEDDVPFYLSAA